MENTTLVTRTTPRWHRRALLGGGLVVLLAGAAGVAWAAGFGPGGMGPGGRMAGLFRDHVEFRIHRALKAVNASEAQETQILAILDGLIEQHKGHLGERKAFHDRIGAALTGDTVDRAALEAIRVDALRHADEGSKDLVKAVADMAEVLTPAQRRQLAELHRQRFE